MLRVLRVLEGRGLISREPARANKRNLSIALTSEGMSLLLQAKHPTDRAYDRLMAPLDSTQRAQLVSLLQLLTSGLECEARAAFVPPKQELASEKT